MEKPLSPPCPRSPPTRVAPPERYKSCVLMRAHTKRETPAIDDSTIRRSLVPSSERVKNLRVNNVNTLEDGGDLFKFEKYVKNWRVKLVEDYLLNDLLSHSRMKRDKDRAFRTKYTCTRCKFTFSLGKTHYVRIWTDTKIKKKNLKWWCHDNGGSVLEWPIYSVYRIIAGSINLSNSSRDIYREGIFF